MRLRNVAACAALLLTTASANAADYVNKPIDTNKYVVQPTQAAASLAAQTIQLAGNAAANTIEKDGFVKTFNNLFRSPTMTTTPRQPNGMYSPAAFQSTGYKSYNTPQMPIMVPTRRN